MFSNLPTQLSGTVLGFLGQSTLGVVMRMMGPQRVLQAMPLNLQVRNQSSS